MPIYKSGLLVLLVNRDIMPMGSHWIDKQSYSFLLKIYVTVLLIYHLSKLLIVDSCRVCNGNARKDDHLYRWNHAKVRCTDQEWLGRLRTNSETSEEQPQGAPQPLDVRKTFTLRWCQWLTEVSCVELATPSAAFPCLARRMQKETRSTWTLYAVTTQCQKVNPRRISRESQ